MSELYVTYCCPPKNPGLNTPDKMYVNPRRIQPFIEQCQRKGRHWAILSPKYGLFFPEQERSDYDVDLATGWGFLDITVVDGGRWLSDKESEAHIKALAQRIRSDASDRCIDRVHFYVSYQGIWWPRGYLALLHYALDGCESMPRDRRELAAHVLGESKKISLFTSVMYI